MTKALNDYKQKEITRKLADICRIIGDGYIFINFRFIMEDIEEQASKSTDPDDQALLKIVEDFYKLCLYMEKHKGSITKHHDN